MKRVCFDLEANGLGELVMNGKKRIPSATVIHCVVIEDLDTGKQVRFRGDNIGGALEILQGASLIVGHNILDYDLPVLCRLHNNGEWFFTPDQVRDTVVMARLLWPDSQNPDTDNSLHALSKKAGGKGKDDYKGPWDAWSQQMEDYCATDVRENVRVYSFLEKKYPTNSQPLKVEHIVSYVIAKQKENGVRISNAAEDFLQELYLDDAQIQDELSKMFPPFEVKKELKTPAYWICPDGVKYKKKGDAPNYLRKWLDRGPNKIKTTLIPFNANSAHHVAAALTAKYKWKAPRTDKGGPSVTEDVLKNLKFPEVEILLKSKMIAKRISQVSDWVDRATTNRTPGIIHPQINTLGAATHRMTHSQPNQTACPKVLTDKVKGVLMGLEGRYGWECRSLWMPTRAGWLQVGGDASGLELRTLANRLHRWDKGKFAKILLEGDIHTYFMKAGGLFTRDQSKTTVYAWLYGSGDKNLGDTIMNHPSLSPEQRKAYKGKSMTAVGKEYKAKVSKNIPALKHLQDFVARAVQRGFVVLLDGRHAPVRSAHSALNTLLQGDGAVVMKWALAHMYTKMVKDGLVWGVAFAFMLNAHDEFQLEAPPHRAEEIGQRLVDSIRWAGRQLKVALPLDGEYKIGTSWAETH